MNMNTAERPGQLLRPWPWGTRGVCVREKERGAVSVSVWPVCVYLPPLWLPSCSPQAAGELALRSSFLLQWLPRASQQPAALFDFVYP